MTGAAEWPWPRRATRLGAGMIKVPPRTRIFHPLVNKREAEKWRRILRNGREDGTGRKLLDQASLRTKLSTLHRLGFHARTGEGGGQRAASGSATTRLCSAIRVLNARSTAARLELGVQDAPCPR